MSRRLTVGAVAVLTFAAVASAVAVAQERYTLRPRFAIGERWSEQRTNTAEMTTAIKVNQQVFERHQQSTRNTLELEWEVLALEGGAPTAARVTFGPNCGTQVLQDGQSQSIKFPGAGTTVTARRLPDGGVKYEPASAENPEVEGVFENLFEVDDGAYPRQPIAVGESWSWDRSAIASAFELAAEDEGSVTCTLKAVRNEQGRQIAEIEFKITLKQGQAQEGGGQRIATLTESNLSGQGQMDIAAGRLISLKLSGNVVTSGIIYVADEDGQLLPQADVEGTGKIVLESHGRLVGGGSPSSPGTTSAPSGQTDFAGEYSNAELTLTLSSTADGWTGSIKMGEREFPVRASSTGNTLRGQFQSDDHWFDFEGTLPGTTLTLTTGGKTHTLQKKTPPPVNPLGGDKPDNPLGGDQPANPLGGGTGGGGGAAAPGAPPITREVGRPAGGRPLAAGSYEVFRCVDERGFRDAAGRPLEVFRMLLPNGWRFNGGVEWKIHTQDVTRLSRVDLVNPAVLHFQVVSADGQVVIQAYPEVHFADLRGSPAYNMGAFPPGSDYGGFVVAEVMDPADYITQVVVPQQRGGLPGARVLESKPVQSLAQRYDRDAATVNAALQGMFGGGVSHRAAMITVEYELGGRPVQEVFVAVLGYLQTPGITMWSSPLCLSVRAPRDEVEQWRPVIATIVNSIQFNMRWIGEYLALKKRAEGVIIDVDRFCQQVDADITRNRAETNAQIHRDMYPRLAPFCDHTGTDGKRYFLETDLQHQMNENGVIRSDISLPETPGWTNMPEYTGP
ncbi:MAG: hypothetical protein PVJ57_15895 [Phycisphaerae bacterium]